MAYDAVKMQDWQISEAAEANMPSPEKYIEMLGLEKDELIKAARKNTGLHDLGRDFWDEPLERLIDSINNEAQLHPVGRFISKQRLVNMLSVRLRAEDYFKKHPEILEQPLYPVIVIIGLQRTGTTKLHRLPLRHGLSH